MTSISLSNDEQSSSDEDDRGNPMKRKRGQASDDKLIRCRERNRIHARNTRERKKLQFENMQNRLENLRREKAVLSRQLVDSTVADILVSLSSNQTAPHGPVMNEASTDCSSSSSLSANFKNEVNSMSNLKENIVHNLSDSEDTSESDPQSMRKDKSQCTPEELDRIRRERNKMHAKKTRIRKKKIMLEIEMNVKTLEEEVRTLRNKIVDQNRENFKRGHMFMQSIPVIHPGVVNSLPAVHVGMPPMRGMPWNMAPSGPMNLPGVPTHAPPPGYTYMMVPTFQPPFQPQPQGPLTQKVPYQYMHPMATMPTVAPAYPNQMAYTHQHDPQMTSPQFQHQPNWNLQNNHNFNINQNLSTAEPLHHESLLLSKDIHQYPVEQHLSANV